MSSIDIQVNGISLPVSKDFKISREFESNIFDRSNKAVDFTLPAQIPLSDEVKKALNLPHIIANPNLKRDYKAFLIIDGVFSSEVTLRIISTNLKTNIVEISLLGDYGSVSRIFGETKVNELTLGGKRTIGTLQTGSVLSNTIDSGGLTINYTPCDTMDHMQDVADGTILTDYTFYMACDEAANIPEIHTRQQAFMGDRAANMPESRSMINLYHDFGGSNIGFIDPVRATIEHTYFNGGNINMTNDRYFWVPFFRLQYVLEQCFKEFGFSIDLGELDNFNFYSVTLFNTYAINRVKLTKSAPTSTSCIIDIEHHGTEIEPKNHVPDMKITEFLTEVGKLMNIQFLLNFTTKSVSLKLLRTLDPSQGKIVDISNRVNPKAEINFESQDIFNGYEFSFKDDSKNSYSSEGLSDNVDSYNMRGVYDNHDDLNGIATPTIGDIAYVKCENAYHQYSGDGWWPFAHNLNVFKTKDADDLLKVEIGIQPVRMKRQHQVFFTTTANTGTFLGDTDQVLKDNVLMPVTAIGMAGDNLLYIYKSVMELGDGTPRPSGEHIQHFGVANGSAKAELPHVANYIGLTDAIVNDSTHYPCGSSTRWGTNGVIHKGENFYFASPDTQFVYGLYPEYWKGFTDKMEQSVQVKYECIWDAVIQQKSPLNETYFKINGLYFLCRSAEIDAPFPSVAELTLVRI